MNLQEFSRSEYVNSPHFLLLGNPVAHSWSPLMHNTAARFHDMAERYFGVELQQDEFSLIPKILNNRRLKGVNITIPYKQKFFNYADVLDAACKQIGVTNALVKEQQKWKGYNTDADGFIHPLQANLEQLQDSGTIIFGTGGAAKAVTYVLHEAGMDKITLVSRNPEEVTSALSKRASQITAYSNWTALRNAKLIVNATPLGMDPYLNESPVQDQEQRYLSNTICYDLIYNPFETRFLKLAKQTGAQTINGLEMLIHQGDKLFNLWTGKSFPISLIRKQVA